MKKGYFSYVILALITVASPVFATAVTSGQLSFTLKSVSPPVVAAQVTAPLYAKIDADIKSLSMDGQKAFDDLLSADKNDALTQFQGVLDAAISAVKQSINPSGLTSDQFLSQDTSVWARPFVEYVGADDDSDVPFYALVNTELRKGTVTDDHAIWVMGMRKAMWHLPRFVGVSFRGVRMLPADVDKYYTVGQKAVDNAFVSSSVRPSVALRFATPLTSMQLGAPEVEAANPESDTKKVAVIFLIQGQTGRPISFFAGSDQQEQEILFANGTPMTVSKRSNVFEDAKLGKTQLILLTEQPPAKRE